MSWLGMQIVNVPPGAAVVETVAPGSEAEVAGLEPGDIVIAVNGRRISATRDIRPAIKGLHRGVVVPLEISRGSTLFTTQAALGAPPSP